MALKWALKREMRERRVANERKVDRVQFLPHNIGVLCFGDEVSGDEEMCRPHSCGPQSIIFTSSMETAFLRACTYRDLSLPTCWVLGMGLRNLKISSIVHVVEL